MLTKKYFFCVKKIIEISQELLSLLLPIFIVDHFSYLNSNSSEDELHLHFEENNKILSDLEGRNIESKGFNKEIRIKYFPLRGKLIYLYVKRYRWWDVESLEGLQRDWNIIAKGTRMTVEFAVYIKEINRYE
tara:strand:- start:393 stop:788 length:396 start_codon:yes stop_codon:yes gene_type:complete